MRYNKASGVLLKNLLHVHPQIRHRCMLSGKWKQVSLKNSYTLAALALCSQLFPCSFCNSSELKALKRKENGNFKIQKNIHMIINIS